MFKMKVIKRLELAKKLKKLVDGDYTDFMRVAGTTVVEDITKNILMQRAVDGSPIKRNTPAVRAVKLRTLGHEQSLIWYRVLIDPGTYEVEAGKTRALVRLGEDRARIGVYLENMGYHFWGISAWIADVIMARWRNYIKAGLHAG